MIEVSGRNKGVLKVVTIVVFILMVVAFGWLLVSGLSGDNTTNEEPRVNSDELKDKYDMNVDCVRQSCDVSVGSKSITVERFGLERISLDDRDYSIYYSGGEVIMRTVVNGSNVIIDSVQTEYGVEQGQSQPQ